MFGTYNVFGTYSTFCVESKTCTLCSAGIYTMFCADAWCLRHTTWIPGTMFYADVWDIQHVYYILCYDIHVYCVCAEFSGMCWPFSAWSPRRRWSVGLWCFLGRPVRTGSGGCTPTYSWCLQISDSHKKKNHWYIKYLK